MAARYAVLALQFWRASGARTIARLDGLVEQVIASYHGPAPWPMALSDLAIETQHAARARVHVWEVTP